MTLLPDLRQSRLVIAAMRGVRDGLLSIAGGSVRLTGVYVGCDGLFEVLLGYINMEVDGVEYFTDTAVLFDAAQQVLDDSYDGDGPSENMTHRVKVCQKWPTHRTPYREAMDAYAAAQLASS